MSDSVKLIFNLNLLTMRLLGFYPPQKFKQLYKLYAYAVYVCLTIPLPTLAAVRLICLENVDMMEFGDSSFIIFQGGCFIFKLIPFIFNADKVRETIYMMNCPAFNNYTKKQGVIFETHVQLCRKITLLFLGFCVVTFVTWAITPFFGRVLKFPTEIWLPFEVTPESRIFIFVYIFICLGGGNGALANSAIDSLVSGMASFATTQLQILKDNLENLSEGVKDEIRKYSENGVGDEYYLKNKIIYNKVKECIMHHGAILSFIHHYELVYSSVAFIQFMAAVLVICVACLQLSLVEPFTFTFFAMISFLFTMLFEIFLYCYFGTTLFEESNSLTSAIYMGSWYEYDLKSRKTLIILMERSKKPIIVTAGKILDLSLVTFTTILRRAYSLLAVLQNY